MVDEKTRKRLPPYVSYRTFLNFIDRLEQGIPARVDRSYLSDRLAGSTGTQLVSALRFLGLVDGSNIPTARIRLIVAAKDVIKRAEVFKQTTLEAYGFILQGSFDPQTATYAQLEELFYHTFELTSDVARKCIKFFVALASDAQVPLSPFITERIRTMHSATGTKKTTRAGTKKSAEKRGIGTNRNLLIPQPLEEIPAELLAKFPIFDPAWSDEVKLSWFRAFEELLRRGLAQNENNKRA